MNDAVAKVLSSHGVDPGTFRPGRFAPGVLTGSVPGARALELWTALRQRFPATGVWPVIRGAVEEAGEEFEYDPAETLRDVPRGSVPAVLTEQIAELHEGLCEAVDDFDGSPDDLADLAAKADASGALDYRGDAPGDDDPWPERDPGGAISLHSTGNISSGKTLSTVGFSLVPVKHPYEVPAYLGFGGWNACPPPEVQVAVLREWERAYGAVPVCVAGDVLECVVDRPPRTKEAAMTLAAEQWAFCDDIVSQGTGSVRRLAMELYRSPQWFFWWD